MPYRAPAVLRENSRVAGKNRTANRKTPRGSRKKPNLGRSPTGRQGTVDVNSHIPCRVPAVLWRDLENSLSKRHGRSTARSRHGLCEQITVALCFSSRKDTIEILATRHGRDVPWYVWISLYWDAADLRWQQKSGEARQQVTWSHTDSKEPVTTWRQR